MGNGHERSIQISSSHYTHVKWDVLFPIGCKWIVCIECSFRGSPEQLLAVQGESLSHLLVRLASCPRRWGKDTVPAKEDPGGEPTMVSGPVGHEGGLGITTSLVPHMRLGMKCFVMLYVKMLLLRSGTTTPRIHSLKRTSNYAHHMLS